MTLGDHFKCQLCDKPGRYTYFYRSEDGKPVPMSVCYRCEEHKIEADWIA